MLNIRRLWLIGIGIALLLTACDKGQIFHKLRPGSVVLAFGDGLTFGDGAEQGLSYPAHLEKLILRKVVNAGVAGEVSADGVRRLPEVLAKHEPDLVILGHDGNNLKNSLDREQFKDNLRRMFETINQRGIPVVMIASPWPGTAGGDVDLYEELSKDLEIPLIRVNVGELLADPRTGTDPIQSRADGYRALAELVAGELQALRIL